VVGQPALTGPLSISRTSTSPLLCTVFNYVDPVESVRSMPGYVGAQLARRGLTPFAQIRVGDGKAVGCTGFLDPRAWPDRPGLRAVEIGFTWLAASAQGSGINAEAKLLLLGYAFETLGVARVDLKTDARNHRCRRALDRLGLSFEGVLRDWSMSWAPGEEGKLRDSAMFAVVASEWPTVRQALLTRLAAAATAG
jgi:RimJ/RimL family protein N-acetyltransferase